MRVEELDLKELLELDPQGGLVRFAGQRALIFDAVAQGLLRKELIDTFGLEVARRLLLPNVAQGPNSRGRPGRGGVRDFHDAHRTS